MIDIRLPLPNDVDVSDMPHMPMHDQRLLKSRSWLKAKTWRGGGPGLGFCMFNMWAAAFRNVPAGSLEADDDMLAEAARCDIDFWLVIKDHALAGWERHGDRYWHPVVSELAWDLWTTRLKARHANAFDRYRLACKRALERNREPPPPIGDFSEWLATDFPASSAYVLAICSPNNALESGDNGEESGGCRSDNRECRSDIALKRSEAKDITPLTPHGPEPGGRKQAGKARGSGGENAEGKAWFAGELGRLQREFGTMAPLLMANLNRPGTSSKFVLVETFKGAFLARGQGGRPEIVLPSKVRADAIWAAHGDWMRAHWPELRVRAANSDEKQAHKGRIRA